jgi:drug/metabolite transporter (DMT)-like permease
MNNSFAAREGNPGGPARAARLRPCYVWARRTTNLQRIPMPSASRSDLVGFGLVVASSLTFAANTTFAVVSYHDGATPVSVATVRMILTTVGLYAVLRAAGGVAPLARRDQIVTLGLGVLIALQAWFLLTAIDRIPIGLAILTLYIYPILMALGAYAIGEERPSPALIGGFAVAFAGLALALDAGGGSLDVLGIAYAAGGAAVFAVAAVASGPIIRRCGDASTVTLWMHFSAAPVFIVVALAEGSLPLPATATGWAAFLAVPVFYTVAMTTFFAAMARIGAVRTGLVMNLEPILSIALGYAVFGQTLTPIQFLGVALVLAGVSAVRLQRARSHLPVAR